MTHRESTAPEPCFISAIASSSSLSDNLSPIFMQTTATSYLVVIVVVVMVGT